MPKQQADKRLNNNCVMDSFGLSSLSMLDIPTPSSSYLPIPSNLSDSSRLRVLSENTAVQNQLAASGIQLKDAVTHPSMKQASKDCTPRRSWKMYIAKPLASTPSKATVAEKQGPSSRTASAKKVGKAKENMNPSARSLPMLKTKNSRLPVPIFSRREA